MLGSRNFSFVKGGPNLIIFLFDGGGGADNPNTRYKWATIGPQRNAIFMAFCWRADAGQKLNAGLVAFFCDFSGNPDQYCKETLYFLIFQGSGPPLPPLDPLMLIERTCLQLECCR